MKKLILLISLSAISYFTQAQDCEGYFPSKKGTVMETAIYNDKGKISSKQTLTIQDVQVSGSKTIYMLHQDMYDDKGKAMSSADYEGYCDNGTYSMSMKSMITAEQMKNWKDMEVNIIADDIEFPANAAPGDKLKDAHMVIESKTNGMAMPDFKIDVTNRVVEAKETITTPAGTFECIKVTANVKIKNIIGFEMNTVEWISKGKGIVKSESYKGDKKKGSTELISLK